MSKSPQPNAYDGMEMAPYHGIELHDDYQGMEAHAYSGGPDDSSEKPAFHEYENMYDENPNSRLRRDLKTRQIAMIALGGALGTGLLIQTGPALANSGPASMLIGYALVGVLCFAVMSAMGEMAAWLPIPSGFTGFAHRFVDPALGFALGWNYWFKYIITTPNNLIAATLIIRYWFEESGYDGPAKSPALYIAILLATIIAINYFGVGIFGEFEFWLSSFKILVLLGLIMFTLILAAGGGPKPATGFKYWNDPGAFAPFKATGSAGKFLGFWNVLTNAVFSFLGAELVGICAAEAANPRKAIPTAVKLTFFRIVFFYLVLILFLGMIVPYNSTLLLSANSKGDATISAEASPFVVAAQIAGVKGIPGVINAFLLVFTFSAANSDLYIATRTLYSLAVEGNAPRLFSTTNSSGTPIYALGASSTFCLIAFLSVDIGAFKTFQYFVALVTIFGILTWISILVSHICFIRARRAQHIPDSALAFVSPFGMMGSINALAFACLITFFNGWATFVHSAEEKFDWRTFIVSYLPIPIYIAMILGYKFIKGSRTVSAVEADLYGGKAAIDREEEEWVAEELRRKGGILEKKYQRLYRITLGNFF